MSAGERAPALILELERIAVERGAHAVFVQADVGDEPAITLYSKLGTREEVLHFDLRLPQWSMDEEQSNAMTRPRARR